MSCSKCALHKDGFATEAAFSEFENLLEKLLAADQFTALGRNPGARFFEIRYKCNKCNSIWILSFPDKAFRGGWNEE